MKRSLLTLILIIVFAIGCKEDDDNSVSVSPVTDISGLWEFTISPDVVFLDTNTHHGYAASDFECYPAVHEEVYLYTNSSGNILGYAGTFRLTGKITGNAITLNVYAHPDGPYEKERPLDELILMSNMILTLDDYEMMKGTGSYIEDPYFIDLANDTYSVDARKLDSFAKSAFANFSDIDPYQLKSIEDDICKVIFSIASYLISGMTDGVVRTMSSDCWLHKDGGGYYAFGHEGPGSIFPILTQSVYFPLEWSVCKVREYNFTISLEGENITYEVLKNTIINSPPVKDLFSKLGFADIPELETALDDFYQEYGGFGISLFYDTNTGNYGLYVNHEKGSNAQNSTLISKMKGAFGTEFVYSGSTINDQWNLRRSDFFVCNSPILILYIIGTNKVSYN